MSIIPGMGIFIKTLGMLAIGFVALLIYDPAMAIDLLIRIITMFFDIGYRTIVGGLL